MKSFTAEILRVSSLKARLATVEFCPLALIVCLATLLSLLFLLMSISHLISLCVYVW